MQTLPIAFLLKGRRAALVGGDERGLSKAHALLQAEALVLIYSDQPAPQLQQFASEHVEVQIKPLDELKQATALSVRLIIVGWEQNIDRQRLTARAQSVGVPVNVIDAPEHCDFFFPAVVDRGPIKVAITTGGVSPFLARWIRQKLETTLSFGLPKIAALLQQVNQWLKDQSMPIHQRTSILGTIVEGPAAQAAETGSMEQALNLAHQQIKQTQMQGSVAIVGAGPGHPELLTLQGKRLLQRADVVLYDRLVDPSILNLAARDARKISVGKKPAESRQSQQQIHDTMIELAQQGLQVCRLKGGDPFIFGRLGEEIQALKQANIPFELAPGISSASGCAAWAGISLTHRELAQSCTFVTAQSARPEQQPDWGTLIGKGRTTVIFMPLAQLQNITQACLRAGIHTDWPVVLLQSGTTDQQKIAFGTIGTIAQLAQKQDFGSPSLLICGQVTQPAVYGTASNELPEPA